MKFKKILIYLTFLPLLLTGCSGGSNSEQKSSSISLNTTTLSLKEGETYQLESTLNNFKEGVNATYETGNDKVVAVNNKGLITATGVGSTFILVSAGDDVATCKVTVTGHSITLNSSSVSMYKGETYQLEASVIGEEGNITYISDNNSVCTVSSAGLVTATGVGNAIIKVSIADLLTTCSINVESCTITLNETYLELLNTETYQLEASVVGSSSEVTFKSSDENVATINEFGLITATGIGQAIISAKCDEEQVSCLVEVKGHLLELELDNESTIYTLGKANALIGFSASIDGVDAKKEVKIKDITDTNADIKNNKTIKSSLLGLHEITFTLIKDEDMITKTLYASFVDGQIHYVSTSELASGYTYDESDTILPLSSNQKLISIKEASSKAYKAMKNDKYNFAESVIKNSGIGDHYLSFYSGTTLTSIKKDYSSLILDFAIYSNNITGLSINALGQDKQVTLFDLNEESTLNSMTSASLSSNGFIHYIHLETVLQDDYLENISIYNNYDNDFYLGKLSVRATNNVKDIEFNQLNAGLTYDHIINDFKTVDKNKKINSTIISASSLPSAIQNAMASNGEFSGAIFKYQSNNDGSDYILNNIPTNYISTSTNYRFLVEFDAYVLESTNVENSEIYLRCLDANYATVNDAASVSISNKNGTIEHFVFDFQLPEGVSYFDIYSKDSSITLYIGNIYLRRYGPNSSNPTTQDLHNSFTFDFADKFVETTNGNDACINIGSLPIEARNALKGNSAFKDRVLHLHSEHTNGAYAHIFAAGHDESNIYRTLNNDNLVVGEYVTIDIYLYAQKLKEFYFIMQNNNDANNKTLAHFDGSSYIPENGADCTMINEGNGIYHLRHTYLVESDFTNSFNIYAPYQGEDAFDCYIGKLTISMTDSLKENDSLKNDNLYTGIWDMSEIIYDEPICLIEHEDGQIYGNFLYNANEIVSVRNYILDEEYDINDFTISEDGKFSLANGVDSSKYLILTQDNITCKDIPNGVNGDGGMTHLGTIGSSKVEAGEILFTENENLYKYCLQVTYKTSSAYTGIRPTQQGKKLYNFTDKIKNGEAVNIVLYGDSISAGCHSSKNLGVNPNLERYGQAFANEVSRRYKVATNFINTSVGGTASEWGEKNINQNVSSLAPDLAIIAFGMNDASMMLSLEAYQSHIENMIRAIRATNPDCDIILVATTVANPLSAQATIQADYLPVLEDIASRYSSTALADMTTISQYILDRKDPFEYFVNNVNHPNDFVVRQYVACLLETIK